MCTILWKMGPKYKTLRVQFFGKGVSNIKHYIRVRFFGKGVPNIKYYIRVQFFGKGVPNIKHYVYNSLVKVHQI